MEDFDLSAPEDIAAAATYHDQLKAKQLPHQVSFAILTEKYKIAPEDAGKLTDKIAGAIPTSQDSIESLVDQYAYKHFSKYISVHDATTLSAAVKLIERLNGFSQINLVSHITESLKNSGFSGFNPDLLNAEEKSGQLISLTYHDCPIDLHADQPLLASSRLLYAINAYYFGSDGNAPLIDNVNHAGKYQVHPIHYHSDGTVMSGAAVIERSLPVHGYGLYAQNEAGLWDSVQDYEISESLSKSLIFEVSHVNSDEAFQALIDRWDYAAISEEIVNDLTGQSPNDPS